MKRSVPSRAGNVIGGDSLSDGFAGHFLCPVASRMLYVIASWGGGWDHVSVSVSGRPDRTPTWAEMEWVRDLLFDPSETVMQLSVPRSVHISNHPGCLHMWRPQNDPIPIPPLEFV